MRNPWRMQDGPDNKINRNNFPMSFQYNGTFKYGKIYPIGLWRTIPGASYQIDSSLALNFMPTSFPIQTRQRAYVHFFYGRDRNFWKDYKDFVNGMNPDLVKPYIDESITKARTGNLLDYLGVPTTIVGNYGSQVPLETLNPVNASGNFAIFSDYTGFDNTNYFVSSSDAASYAIQGIKFPDYSKLVGSSLPTVSPTIDNSTDIPNVAVVFDFVSPTVTDKEIVSISVNYSMTNEVGISIEKLDSVPNFEILPNAPTPIKNNTYAKQSCVLGLDSNGVILSVYTYDRFSNGKLTYKHSYGSKSVAFAYKVVNVPQITFNFDSNSHSNDYYNQNYTHDTSNKYKNYKVSVANLTLYSSQPEVRDIDENTSPYWRSGATTDLRSRIKLNAIPCRMYETIYNLYYRNPQNNPYILNGKPEYNVFIPTKDGGPDSNLYELRYRNWEDDFLTTAVQTPQQGIAPLVGLTDRGATVTLTNDDGSVTRYKTNLDENGNVTGIETTDSSEPLLTQALIDAVSYGISIEDLRNVNAMQKWLELNLRKGYQYKDIIEARWGISISYNELDLPEFIGGFTQEVGLQAVTQTTSHGEGIEGALGWQAGRMYASGSGRSITHYCEEEGYIMALLCVVPVPNYSQLLPKHWFTRDLLDSYQPEFNHIGFQPITYKEVCPIQAFQESTENVDVLEQTFGYQRPWYEYFNQVDEVHGQFRTTFKDFLINRTFDVKPELSESFLLVDPNQINDVFAVTTDDDKIIGAIEHRITAKLPISLYAQARLE